MGLFERYLTLWVALSIILGVGLGQVLGDSIQVLSGIELYTVNIPVMILVWFMIYPMMVQIDFSAVSDWNQYFKGMSLTVIVNWVIKPFSMAAFAWLFFGYLYRSFIDPELAREYIAGAILLGAAPCTAMVFVWSYLTNGNAKYTVSQVAINDLIILVAFIPIVKFLLGVNEMVIPWSTLLTSVVAFVVVPLSAGVLSNKLLNSLKGEDWFQNVFLKRLKPLSITALLLTLVILFAYQGEKILQNPFHILLIAIPLTIQTYFIFFISWKAGCRMKLPHDIVSPGSMIGASNFFELAVAVAIALFGLNSGASLVTVVGVLIEVPVMLSLVKFSNRHKYEVSK